MITEVGPVASCPIWLVFFMNISLQDVEYKIFSEPIHLDSRHTLPFYRPKTPFVKAYERFNGSKNTAGNTE